jgi:negative regulator of genetic competence, sporulation and motility
MEIHKIGRDTFKITVCSSELRQMDLSYAKLNYREEQTLNLLRQALKQIEQDYKLHYRLEQLYVEIFPDRQDGCILYFNPIEVKCGFCPTAPQWLCGRFSSLAALRRCTSILSDIGCEDCHYNEVYDWDAAYYLCLPIAQMQKEKLRRLLCEFGQLLPMSTASVLRLQEYGKLIRLEPVGK